MVEDTQKNYTLSKDRDEAKNSEPKNVHGYGRATSYGIENMQMQRVLAIFTAYLKRIIKLAP